MKRDLEFHQKSTFLSFRRKLWVFILHFGFLPENHDCDEASTIHHNEKICKIFGFEKNEILNFLTILTHKIIASINGFSIFRKSEIYEIDEFWSSKCLYINFSSERQIYNIVEKMMDTIGV